MQVLRNSWYMVGWAGDLGLGGKLLRVVANEPVVVERSAADQLIGYCEGAARRTVATVIKHRMIWVWLGNSAESDASRIPDFSCFDAVKDSAFFCGHLPTLANYELLTDNILDLSHADFLHPETLGGGVFTRNPPLLKRDGLSLTLTWEATNDVALPVFDRMLPHPGQPAHVRIEVRWVPSAVMLLRAQVAPAGERLEDWFDTHAAHVMTPETDFKTHYFYGAARNYKVDDADFNAFQAEMIGRAFEYEDKPLIEAQQRAMGRAKFFDLKPVLLPIDSGAVQARRVLSRLIANEWQPP